MKISEFELIDRIRQNLVMTPTDALRGVGDDCAIIKKDDDSVLLISTDCLIEKVHFDLKYFSFIELGKKAMTVNLSDIAAMGGEPRYAFVTLGIPSHVEADDITDFYTGMQQVASEFGAGIVGGDTSDSPKVFFINLTVVGVAKNGQYKLRSTAKVGDGIYLSGVAGSSAVGLKLLEKKRTQDNPYLRAHKNPRPRIQLGQILGASEAVHAMIDTSDGLVQDLSHILRASQVAAEINYEDVPRDEGFEEMCRSVGLNAEETLFSGGEDYQLLFTMDDTKADELQARLTDKRHKIQRIGHIVEKASVSKVDLPIPARIRILRDGKEINLNRTGYDHFLGALVRS